MKNFSIESSLMVNFNLVNERSNGVKTIPRLNFMTPEPKQNSGQSNLSNFINFCQSGCQLDFKFENISSCVLANTGEYLSITPAGVNRNLVLWNGTDVNGLELTPFFLKEIYFMAPSKDKVTTETINQSIQYYLTFVNQQFPNLMICVSVIGQANNVGNFGKTNGFVLLETLANSIPMGPGQNTTLSNLSQFNLGALLPDNKSFFTTLVEDNNIQYIILSKIVDIPQKFFDLLVGRVLGSRNRYDALNTQLLGNPPVNEEGTIIFYNENIAPMGIDEGLICDANCSQIPGKSVLTPKIGEQKSGGKRRPAQVAGEEEGTFMRRSTRGGEEEEYCVEDEVEPGSETEMELKQVISEKALIMKVFFILFLIGAMFIFIYLTFKFLFDKFGLVDGSFVYKLVTSGAFVNPANLPWVILGGICILNVIVCFSVGAGLGSEFIDDYFTREPTDEEEEETNNGWWISILVGLVVATAILGVIKGFTKSTTSSFFVSNLSGQYPLLNALNGLKQGNLGPYRNLSYNQQRLIGNPSDINAGRYKHALNKQFFLEPRVKEAIKNLARKYPNDVYVKTVLPAAEQTSQVALTPSQFKALVEIGSSKLR